MLSLSPRFDLFKFEFPKDFIPDDIMKKYNKVIQQNAGVIFTPIDYLNESIQGITIPGISNMLIEQSQVSHRKSFIEPEHKNLYLSPSNPLSNISNEFKVTFRMNQGLYNYFMLYEIAFAEFLKYQENPCNDVFSIFILNETGNITTKINLNQVMIDTIDGLEFSYNKIDRESNTFDVTFKFNNIDFEFLPNMIGK